MKRLLAALTLALLVSVAIGVGVASASHSNGAGPKQDLVSGTSHYEEQGYDALLHVNAKSGPSGEDPRGRFVFTQSFLGTTHEDVSGRVTCVSVNGNRAGVGGVVTKSKNQVPRVGSGIIISVEDRGHGAEDAGSVFFTSAPPPECSYLASVDFQKGNFIVHDATP